jgi:hypothetical protein
MSCGLERRLRPRHFGATAAGHEPPSSGIGPPARLFEPKAGGCFLVLSAMAFEVGTALATQARWNARAAVRVAAQRPRVSGSRASIRRPWAALGAGKFDNRTSSAPITSAAMRPAVHPERPPAASGRGPGCGASRRGNRKCFTYRPTASPPKPSRPSSGSWRQLSGTIFGRSSLLSTRTPSSRPSQTPVACNSLTRGAATAIRVLASPDEIVWN